MIDISRHYSISEAGALIGYSNHVLRFYEKEFELEIPRNKSGHRYYTYVEVERFLYIKTLKERGLSNKQIKTILNSPEELMGMDEVSVTSAVNNFSYDEEMRNDIIPINNLEGSFSDDLAEVARIFEEKLDDNFKDLGTNLIDEIKSSLQDFKTEYNNEDKDALISENARLRMKLKERAYETAVLKEKLKKAENRKGSFFKKLFGESNKGAVSK